MTSETVSAVLLTDDQRDILAIRSTPLVSDFSDVKLPDLPDVPGMITPAEGRFYYWLTSRGYTGAGAVVEVGPWLGRSTVHIAAGLRDAGFPEHLDCFDRFTWYPLPGDRLDLGLRRGDDFQALWEANVRPVYPKVRATRCPMQELRWDGGAVELLFLDAPKRLPDISSMLAAFGPHLIPGVSLVVLQDYLHFPSYALAVIAAELSDRLSLLHVVEGTTAVSFAVTGPLDFGESQPASWNFERWAKERALATWERALDPLPCAERQRLAPGIAMLLHDIGETEAATDVLRRLDLDSATEARWIRFAQSSLYERYEPLFRSLVITDRLRLEKAIKIRRRKVRRVARRRAWRQRYLRARHLGRRLLTGLGIPRLRGHPTGDA